MDNNLIREIIRKEIRSILNEGNSMNLFKKFLSAEEGVKELKYNLRARLATGQIDEKKYNALLAKLIAAVENMKNEFFSLILPRRNYMLPLF